MRALAVAFVLFTLGCGHTPEQRAPAQAPDPAKSEEFLSHEQEPRRHTFILLGERGQFGYHVTQFKSPHQHQLIVSSELNVAGKNAKQVSALLTGAKNGYFSVTSNKPEFRLREIFEGTRRKFPATMYDGLIITKPPKIVPGAVSYEVKEILKHSPMIAEDSKPANAAFYVFGYEGKPRTQYFLAHVIKGANNYEQVLVAEFEKAESVPNGAILVLNRPDREPVAAKQVYEGQIDGQNVKVNIVRQVYFDARTSTGGSDY